MIDDIKNLSESPRIDPRARKSRSGASERAQISVASLAATAAFGLAMLNGFVQIMYAWAGIRPDLVEFHGWCVPAFLVVSFLCLLWRRLSK